MKDRDTYWIPTSIFKDENNLDSMLSDGLDPKMRKWLALMTPEYVIGMLSQHITDDTECHCCGSSVDKCDVAFDETAFVYSYRCAACKLAFTEVYLSHRPGSGERLYFPLLLWRVISL